MIRINCDLCGKVEQVLSRALIESVELNVCSGCAKFGKVIGPLRNPVIKNHPNPVQKEEKIELLVEDYHDLVKKKRESMGLSQKDFALKVNEKDSTIHKIETGILEPPIALAKKLERFLGIKLLEEHQETHASIIKKKSEEGFTLGDFIKIKK